MKNTRKRTITILLTLVMAITILLGNGIEARAAEYFLKFDDLKGHELKSGDVIIADDRFEESSLTFYDGNNDSLSIKIKIKRTERHTIQTSYKNGNGEIVGTGAKWKCVNPFATYLTNSLTLKGEPYIPQTEEKKPESTPPKEVEAQPIVADQPEIAEEERRDVTTVISFEYKGEKYRITFSPEADYDALLNDEEQFYGYLGLSGYKGITVEKVDPQS